MAAQVTESGTEDDVNSEEEFLFESDLEEDVDSEEEESEEMEWGSGEDVVSEVESEEMDSDGRDSKEERKFQLGEPLGKGGNGSVYRGSFRGNPVAIKRIDLLKLADNREEIMSSLHYIHLIRLFHVEADEDFKYFVLELCDGTLEDYFEEKYKGPMASELDALNQMARGLRYIHKESLVHRDIKPENVLISQKSSTVYLKISDFGLCKATTERGSFSQSGCKGTLNYMAPELLQMLLDDASEGVKRGTLVADIFSLGLVFSRFLAGETHRFKHPYANPNPLCIPDNIINERCDLSALHDHIWYDLIRRMLSKHPEPRPEIGEICLELQTGKPESPPGTGCRRQRCYEPNVRGDVICCRFHPTKPKLACGLDGGRICLFSGATYSTPFGQWNKTIWKAETNSNIRWIDWKVDGSKLAAGCNNGTVVVWEEDGTKSFEMKKHSECVTCIQWNKVKKGNHLFVTGYRFKGAIVWNSNHKNKHQAVRQVFPFHRGFIRDVTWISADQFASCSKDGTIKICQLGQSKPITTFAEQRWIRSLRWNESDRRLASCSEDGSIKIWSLDREEPMVTLESGGYRIYCMDWHRRIQADEASSIRWWIVGGCRNGVVLVWDLQVDGPAKDPRRLSGQSNGVCSVVFSPDGRILASADLNGNVFIWWTKKWETVFQVQAGELLDWQRLEFASSGNKLAIPNNSSEVLVVEFD